VKGLCGFTPLLYSISTAYSEVFVRQPQLYRAVPTGRGSDRTQHWPWWTLVTLHQHSGQEFSVRDCRKC